MEVGEEISSYQVTDCKQHLSHFSVYQFCKGNNYHDV